jgi:hypothetical protein
LGFDPELAPSGVNVQTWNFGAQEYNLTLYGYIPGVGWDPSEPELGMAEACILVTADDGVLWARTFDVQ